ncbi:DUF1365 domain-containing protein [Acinetobacter sp. GSS19]|uniref:DUF1365 domain-containing protein n=1 Tax=Acinetobacter sp. GSS19 TaxID=3020716 RepID=UPI002361D5AB|nr:DUF1365 domain-containing protein [Acinetobacter sp. GSS19]
MFEAPLAIAQSTIRHRRYVPKAHDFTATLDYLCFDPDQLDHLTRASWLWSSQKCNLLSLHPQDFLAGYSGDLREKLAKVLMHQANYVLPASALIRILTLPRSMGFRFNSVVFYFIADACQQLLFIVSEITNTPWNERKVYVHDCRMTAQRHPPYQRYQFDFDKSFHVSPFMPMTLHYRWHFSFSPEQSCIHMQLIENEKLIFDATMRFVLHAITTPSQQAAYAVKSALQPLKMLGLIYLHAYRLWCKKIPFYRHPKKIKDV